MFSYIDRKFIIYIYALPFHSPSLPPLRIPSPAYSPLPTAQNIIGFLYNQLTLRGLGKILGGTMLPHQATNIYNLHIYQR